MGIAVGTGWRGHRSGHGHWRGIASGRRRSRHSCKVPLCSLPAPCQPQQSHRPVPPDPAGVGSSPALTEANSPSGGVAWPHRRSRHSPQQATVPSRLTPQVCFLTRAHRGELPFRRRGLADSQSSAPAGHRPVHPHPAGVVLPALTEANSPSGGVAWPGCHSPSRPPSRPPSPRRCASPPRSPRRTPFRRRRLASHVDVVVHIRSPAGHRPVPPHPAGVPVPRAHRGELPFRRRRLASLRCRGSPHSIPSRPPSRPASPRRCAPHPALTEANSPSGGVAWPPTFP